MLDARRLALMKPTAFLVNVARGAIVDQEALVGALRKGRLAGVGLDVVDPEPLPADDPLLALPNVVGAPHSLGYTDELLRGCVGGTCAALLACAAGEVPPEVANPDVLDNPLFVAKLARFTQGGHR
jgi:phosphoglycerate dehydrogenase-like enzyme